MVLKHRFICILLFNVFLKDTLADDNEECSCIDLILDEVKTCKDWETAPVKLDFEVNVDNDYGSMKGNIKAGAAIVEGVEISMRILFQTSKGAELVYSAAAEICQSFNDKKAMWYPIIEIFNTTRCPIPKGNFDANDVKINLASIKSIFNKDFLGSYIIIVSAEMGLTKYMCFVVEADMIEEKRPCNECPFS